MNPLYYVLKFKKKIINIRYFIEGFYLFLTKLMVGTNIDTILKGNF